MQTNMLYLTIHHSIYLKKEERYSLHEGKDVLTIGVSLPVWRSGEYTSEPGREVFCKYLLKNPRTEVPIQILSDGYEIALPYQPEIKPEKELTEDEWRALNQNHPEKLDQYYKQWVQEVSSKNLLDIEDGGQGSLIYREYNKIKNGSSLLTVKHFVVIGVWEDLINSID